MDAKWIPIATAPKDGSQILTYLQYYDVRHDAMRGVFDVVIWLESDYAVRLINPESMELESVKCCWLGGQTKIHPNSPSHWMPIPKPPEQES